MFFINKFITRKILVYCLVIISLYNIFSIFIIYLSPKNNGYLSKFVSYLPYKYSIFFIKPLLFTKKDIQVKSDKSKKLYNIISKTEKNSGLDYFYWEIRMLYQINNIVKKEEFERNFINLFILSKNNERKSKSLKLYYLRNVPRFSKNVKELIMSR